MGDDLWIVVPNWDKFQHYKSRTPVWLKLYLELLHKPEFMSLTLAERGLLLTVWLETGASNGQISTRRLRSTIRQSHFDKTLESLNHAGFIQLSASKPLAQRREEKRRKSGAHAPTTKPVSQSRDLETLTYDPAMAELYNGWLAKQKLDG